MAGGGGSGTSTTSASLPPELRSLYRNVSNQLIGGMNQNPITDFNEMDPRQIAGVDPLQQEAYDNVSQLFGGQSESLASAQDMAARLGNQQPWGGTDLGGVGGLSDVDIPAYQGGGGPGGQGGLPPREDPFQGQGRESGFQLPGRENLARDTTAQINMPGQPGQVAGPENVDSALQNIDFGSHPALQSAMKAFQASAMPGIANSMAAAGLSRSGASGKAVADAKAQIALPVMQQLMGLSVQERGQDIGQEQFGSQFGLNQRGQDIGMRSGDINAMLGQRGQDIQSDISQRGQDVQSLLGQRGQDISGTLGARGQDVAQRGQDLQGDIAARGQDVGQRGQDVQSLIQSMGLGLQARGQDINAMIAGRGQDLGARGQDIGAILQQGGQDLGARGQDIGATQAGMAGMMGVDQAELNQLLAGLSQGGQFGGLFRGIDQAGTDAEFDEENRQYNMARELLLAPLGGINSQVGSSTVTKEGK